ncbi:MAG: hypothetical protein QM739_14680 [Propionivibrio sp.]
MSRHPTENCDAPSLDKSEKDSELVPKDFPYLKRLLAEIDQLRERKPVQPIVRKNPERRFDAAKPAVKHNPRGTPGTTR